MRVRIRALLLLAAFVSANGLPASPAHAAGGGAFDLLTQAGIRLDGAAAAEGAGTSVASAGDVNGDGRPDLLIGAPGAGANARAGSGSVYVVFARPAATIVDLAAIGTAGNGDGFRIDGAAAGDAAGSSVAPAGDVNRDGLADVLVGAPNAGPGGRAASGAAYVVFGKASASAVDLDALGAGGYAIHGAAVGDRTGTSVAPAGDVNGDGRPDLVIGAPSADANSRLGSGSAYVVFGSVAKTAVDLSALGAGGYRIDGASAGDMTGRSVASAGDVNGDGRPDLLIGAPNAGDNGRPASGSAYVVFGKASAPAVDLAVLGAGGYRIDGGYAGDHAGTAVAPAGDVNGDGRPDVAVGAPDAYANEYDYSGSAYVVFGQAAAAAIDLAALDANGYRIDGAAESDTTGRALAPAGDVNGDGRPDLLVGVSAEDGQGRKNAGTAYVVFGQASTTPIDLAALGDAGYRIDGAAAYGYAGASVASAGDVNGDGLLDFLIGANGMSENGRFRSGSAYVEYGIGVSEVAYPAFAFGTAGALFNPFRPIVTRHAPAGFIGSASYTITPALPAGLSLDAANGVITGTPVRAQPVATYTVTMTDLTGIATAAFALAIAPAPALAPRTRVAAPVLTRVRLSHVRVHVARQRTARRHRRAAPRRVVRFTLNERATVRIAFTRRLRGHRVKGACVARTRKRHARRCTRSVAAGRMRFAGKRGANTKTLRGRHGLRKRLAPGAYVAVLVARSADGRRSRTVTVRFKIAR